MKIRTYAIAAALAFGQLHAEVLKPRADLSRITTAAGELTMVHTIIPMNNAHDVELLGFIKRTSDGPAIQVPFESARGYEPLLSTRGGADCMLSRARVLRDGLRLRVVYAQREGGWRERKPVTFDVFELAVNDAEAPGTPPLYFVLKGKVETRKAYCDVDEALDQETALYARGAGR